MRNDRVYSHVDLPGSSDALQPLRALRSVVGPQKFATLLVQRRNGDFRAADTAQLSRVGAFIGAALSSWYALERERDRAAFERKFSQDFGLFWLQFSSTGGVLDASPQLRARLSGCAAVQLHPDGWLEIAEPITSLAFRRAIAVAQVGGSEVVELSADPPLHILISERAFGDQRRLMGLLYRAPTARSLPVGQLASHFGLSRAEARLTQLLCDGFTIQDASVELGWTRETARSCSKQIFARLGVRGQTGVLRKVLTSAVWLA